MGSSSSGSCGSIEPFHAPPMGAGLELTLYIFNTRAWLPLACLQQSAKAWLSHVLASTLQIHSHSQENSCAACAWAKC